MIASSLPLIAVLLPLAGAPFVALLGRRPNLREAATLITGVVLLSTVASLAPAVLAGARPTVHLIDILPGLSLSLQVEPLGMLFALIASSLWIVTSIYAIGYMRGQGFQY